MRLAICLYRLRHGNYYFTIAEMSGVGVSTVAAITVIPSTGLYGQVVGILAIHMTQSSCKQLRYAKK